MRYPFIELGYGFVQGISAHVKVCHVSQSLLADLSPPCLGWSSLLPNMRVFGSSQSGQLISLMAALIVVLVAVILALLFAIFRQQHFGKALRQKESLFRRIFESPMIGLFEWGLDGQVRSANQTFLEMVGYTREELEAGAIQWSAMTPPEYAQRDVEAVEEMRRFGTVAPYEKQYVRKDGSRVDVLLGAEMLDSAEGLGVAFVLDVTERMRAEDALRKSEQRFRAIFHSSFHLVALLTPQGEVIEANETALCFAGLRPEDVVGKPFWEGHWWRGDESRVRRLQESTQRAAAGEFVRYTVDVRGADSDETIDFSLKPVVDGDGHIGLLMAEGRVITELKRAEAKIESIARFPAENPSPVLRVDLDGKVLFANEAGCKLLKASWNCDVGALLTEPWFGHVMVAAESATCRQAETICAGSIYSLAFTPVAEGGYVNIYGMDVTEQRRAEEQFRESERRLLTLMRNLPGMAYRCENVGDWPMSFVSQGCAALTGYPASRLTDSEPLVWNDLMHPDDRQMVWDVVQDAVAAGRPFQIEYRIRTREGKEKWVWERGACVGKKADGTGVLEGFIGDVTERILAEKEREALITKLEAQNAELERFAYTVSHDLRSPLITVMGYTGALRQDIANGDADAVEDSLTRITSAAEKMEQLLKGLLELSRIGRLVNPPNDVSLAELAVEARDLILGPTANPAVRVEISQELPVVYGDRLRLFEVLQNLIDNAVKYTADTPHPLIEIGTRRKEREIVCYVRDNGIGIAPHYHEKVFGLFEQLDQQINGSGIGLALVKRIIEFHGGRIWVESDGLGNGTTFWFTIPGRSTAADQKGIAPQSSEA
jgi:PAS domain S-box-containing protein